MRRTFSRWTATTLAAALTIGALACGPEGSAAGTGGGGEAGGGGDAPGPETVTLYPDAPPLPGESECRVDVVKGISVKSQSHVEVCTHVDYETNPPSGGDHWPFWAAFKAYTSPVPREMVVHSLEHGAVALSYRCTAPCGDVRAALESVFEAIAPDPLCATTPGGPTARALLVPDPALATPIAAAAWGATYTATCIDEASLAQFVADVYGQGPEKTCAAGRDIESPSAGVPECD